MQRREVLKAILALPILPFLLPKPGRTAPPRKDPTLLLATMIAGFQYHDGEKILPMLREGQPLRLVRERRNRFDDRAIAVYRKEHKLGFIPRADNSVLAGLMDEGYTLKGEIGWIDRDAAPWEKVGVLVGMKG